MHASVKNSKEIWSELSATDRKVALAIAKSETGKVADVRRLAGMDTNHFNPYRDTIKSIS